MLTSLKRYIENLLKKLISINTPPKPVSNEQEITYIPGGTTQLVFIDMSLMFPMLEGCSCLRYST